MSDLCSIGRRLNLSTNSWMVKKKVQEMLIQRQEHLSSLTKLAERTVAEAEKLADGIKKELDIMQREAQKLGLRKGKLTGRAFPQVLNKEGKAFLEEAERDGRKSSKVFAWAQTQISEGKFKSVDDAIIAR